MRPIIGVNGDCLWLCGDVCHPPPSLPAPRSVGKLRRWLTGTGAGSNFCFVPDLRFTVETRLLAQCPVSVMRERIDYNDESPL